MSIKKVCAFLTAIALFAGIFSISALAEDSYDNPGTPVSPPVDSGEVIGAPSPWAIDYVNRALEEGLLPEELHGRYVYPITRAEFCALAVRVYESVRGTAIIEYRYFTDTSDINVQKMGGLGVVNGIGDGLFAPDLHIAREEAAVMLSSLSAALDRPLRDGSAAFADFSSISEWARDDIGKMRESGIMGGIGGNMFAPRDTFTIEQSIKTMLLVYDIALSPQEAKIAVGDPEAAGRKIPILMYHAVAEVPTTSLTSLFVRPAELEAQLKYIAENGYQTITFEDLDNIGAFTKPIMLTFDDGYADNYSILFPLLKKYNLKATIFVVTYLVWNKDFCTVENLKEMSDSGLVSIQSHTMSHYRLTTIGAQTLRNELEGSKQFLEELTGRPVTALSYPEGARNSQVQAECANYYTYAVLNSGGQFVCGGNLLAMGRVRINRGLDIKTFASMI